jgi:hypothetical protein
MLKMMIEMITETEAGIGESGFRLSICAFLLFQLFISVFSLPHTLNYFLSSLLFRPANSED